jgi:competence protein ComEA
VLTLYRYDAAFEPTVVLPGSRPVVVQAEDSSEVYLPAVADSGQGSTPVGSASAGGKSPPAPPVECVNVNTADIAGLTSLPGVGPVLAERIISYRQQHGSFKDGTGLCEVKGIGKARLEKIKDRICF